MVQRVLFWILCILLVVTVGLLWLVLSRIAPLIALLL